MNEILNSYNKPAPPETIEIGPSTIVAGDKEIDDLFSDFGRKSIVKEQPKEDNRHLHVIEKREIIELISYKTTMVYLEKVLIICKNNQLSEGKCMGHIGLEFAGVIDPEDGKNVVISADFTNAADVWSNPSKIKRNSNPQIKEIQSFGFGESNISNYNVNDFNGNILLFEYQLNPKEIRLIPLSVQYRTAFIDGLIYMKIFLHANPKLPKRLFDFEIQTVLKEKDKLILTQSIPHANYNKEEISLTLPGLDPDQKY